jgi:hypothetical protein
MSDWEEESKRISKESAARGAERLKEYEKEVADRMARNEQIVRQDLDHWKNAIRYASSRAISSLVVKWYEGFWSQGFYVEYPVTGLLGKAAKSVRIDGLSNHIELYGGNCSEYIEELGVQLGPKFNVEFVAQHWVDHFDDNTPIGEVGLSSYYPHTVSIWW